jgi:lipid A 4'-phosphatase
MAIVALLLILLTGLITGIVVAIDPAFDLQIASYFYRPDVKATVSALYPWIETLRDYHVYFTAAFVLVSLGSIVLKLIRPRGPLLVPARASLLILSTFALGPALLTNGILKPHSGRPRPAAVVELGGTQPFVQWWDWRGECDGNCSFVSGEASGAYALLAPAAVVPGPWRIAAIGAAVVYGTAIGLIRVAVGGHFMTDVIFAGVFTALIVWLLHGCMYRWTRTRLREEAVAQMVGNCGLAIQAKIARLLPSGRIGP